MKATLFALFALLYLTIPNTTVFAQCPASTPKISGAQNVCLGITTTYNINVIWPATLSITGGGWVVSSTTTEIKVQWSSPGNWKVVANIAGCTTLPTVELNVTVSPSTLSDIPPDITGNFAVCQNSISTYSIPSGSSLTPVWSITNPAVTPQPPTPTLIGRDMRVTWNALGGFIVSVAYTNGVCIGNAISRYVSVTSGTAPVSISGSSVVCAGQSVTYTADGDAADIYTWFLPSGGGVITSNGRNATVQWSTSGTFSVSVSGNNSCGGTRTGSRTVTVGPAVPPAPGTITKQTSITCLNQTERFTVGAVSGATEYIWSFREGYNIINRTTSSPFVEQAFSKTADWSVSVAASNGSCTGPNSATLSFVTGRPSLTINAPESACLNSEITLSVTSNISLAGYPIRWGLPDGVIIGAANGTSVVARFVAPGQKFLNVSVTTPCGEFGATLGITNGSPLNIHTNDFSLAPPWGVENACLGTYTYVSGSSQTAVSYGNWSISPPLPLTSASSIYNTKTTVTFETPGSYTISITGQNGCGKSSTQTKTITVSPETKPNVGLINGVSFETICTSSPLPIGRSYSVENVPNTTYVWAVGSPTTHNLTATGNAASVVWNNGASPEISVLPMKASCSGEKVQLFPSISYYAVGTLSASASTMCVPSSADAITLSLTSQAGIIKYRLRKKFDFNDWSSWQELTSNYVSIDVILSGMPTTGFEVIQLEFQAIASSHSCSDVRESNVVPVTVYRAPFIVNPDPDFYNSVCSGGTVSIVPESSLGATSFVWTSSSSASILGAAASGTGSISNNLINTSTSIGSVSYTVTPTKNGCAGYPRTFERHVYPRPAITPVSAQTICNARYGQVDLQTPALAQTSYSWPDPDGSGPATAVSGKFDAVRDIEDFLVNSTDAPLNVTYRLTPTYHIASGQTCIGTTSDVIVQVQPVPKVTSAASLATCSDVRLNHTLTSNIPSTFVWNGTTMLTGQSRTSINSSLINDRLSNFGNTPVTATYNVTPTSITANCPGASQTLSVTVNPLPVASIQSQQSVVCSDKGLSAPIQSSVPASFIWRALDAPAVLGETIAPVSSSTITDLLSHTNSTPLIVQYVITGTSLAGGCVGPASTIGITVNPKPTVSIANNGPTEVCQGSAVALNQTNPSTTFLQRLWQLNGTNISGATSSSYNASSSGNYSLLFTNTYNCSSVSNTVQVKVDPIPSTTVTANGSTTFCQGKSVTLTAPAGSGLTYRWLNSGVPISNATGQSFIASSSGKLSVVVNSNTGCSRTSSEIPVTLIPNPTALISASGSVSFCSGESVTLSTPLVSGITYQWRRDGVNIAGATIPSYVASSSGSYRLVVTNSNNCSDSTNVISVTAKPLPVAQISATGATTVCTLGVPNIPMMVRNASANNTYQWRNNRSNIRGATGISYSASASGNYTCIVTMNDCSTESNAVSVTVIRPEPPVISSTGNLCLNGAEMLTASSYGAASYAWSTQENTESIYVYAPGTYSVTADYGSGCTASSSKFIDVCGPVGDPCGNPYIFCDTQTASSVYPNPADESVGIQIEASETDRVVNVYDQHGKVVYQEVIKAGRRLTLIDTSSLSAGVYMIQVVGRKEVLSRRLVVQHAR